jgi:DNA-binding transcriptional ArsR family regulator
MQKPLRNWFWSEATVEIAAQLLAAEADETRRVDEIAQALDLPERRTRHLLGRLYDGRLVERAKLVTGESGRPAWAYSLTDDQRVIAQRAVDTPQELWPARTSSRSIVAREGGDPTLEEPEEEIQTTSPGTSAMPTSTSQPQAAPSHGLAPEPGRLRPGQELVVVDVGGSAFADLLETLSSASSANPAQWVTRIGHELIFAFDGSDRVSAAAEFLAVLAGARLSVRQASVTQVTGIEDLFDQAQRVSPAILRARMTRDAHNAPQ